jgi:hypothetical protein
MDPNQIPPPPDGSQAVPTGQTPPPPPDGSGIVDQSSTPAPHNDEIKITAPATSLKGIAQRGGSMLEGLGEGIFSTAAGVSDIANKVIGDGKPGVVSHTLHKLAGDENTPGSSNNYNKVGYGGETIAEFMLGDEALKGLSHADKLGTVSKWMKIAEKSPRLIKAIQTGADLAKVQGELSPEEIALIQKYPKLAKYVGIGVNAARAGVVQGAQSTVRSGGDVGKGVKDGLATAATGAVLGTAARGVANTLRKGGKAAQTIAEMNDVAAGAPSAHDVESELGSKVNDAFSNETGELQNNLDDATSQVGMYGEGAPQQASITSAAQKAAKLGKQAVHDQYQAGLDHLVEMSGEQTIPYEDSPLHKAAQELAAYTPETAGPLDSAFQVAQPGSPKANALIDRLANFGQDAAEGEEGEAPKPDTWTDADGVTHTEPTPEAEPQEEVPSDLTMQHLVARRQTLAKTIRDLGPNDRADREIYGKLLNGIDDTIAKLADNVGEPMEAAEGEEGEATQGDLFPEGYDQPKTEARAHFDQMNADYKRGIRPFQNSKVKAMLKGNLNDVTKKLMGGQTSVADITDAKQAMGEGNFKAVARASLQNIVQDAMDKDSGELDYKGLFQKLNKMNHDVRTAMFGGDGKALADALKVTNSATTGLTEIGKQVGDLLGNGKIEPLLNDPARVKQIANLVGPDGMKSLGRSIMENTIKEASTTLDSKTGEIKPSNFDPDKVLDWWMKLKDKPEVRDAFFNTDKETAKNYNDMMKNLADASSVKKLVKYGVLPVTMGTAGVIHGPGAALFGALAGLGTEAGFGRARDILDVVANNPRTWKLIGGAGKVADKASAAVKQPVRNAGAAAIYKGVTSVLGGDDKE